MEFDEVLVKETIKTYLPRKVWAVQVGKASIQSLNDEEVLNKEGILWGAKVHGSGRGDNYTFILQDG